MLLKFWQKSGRRNSIMKWSIPAKTFLLGEYAALNHAPGILLTTSPCFEIILEDSPQLEGIHPDSPAGRYWARQKHPQGLKAYDPYTGKGGMGASSAQFVAAYLASQYLQNKKPDIDDMLISYGQAAWSGVGQQPSGYDVLAQTQASVVYANRGKGQYESLAWPFEDLSFLLVHTRQKLATHHHLQSVMLPCELSFLSDTVERAYDALIEADIAALLDAVRAYHQELLRLNLVAPHTREAIHFFSQDKTILAAKGCGAMGSDVILLLVERSKREELMQKLQHLSWTLLATETDLHKKKPLISNNRHKTLEISA